MQAFLTLLCSKSCPETGNESNACDVISRAREIDRVNTIQTTAQCRRLYTDISGAISDSNDSSEYVFGAHYMPYEGEPLAPQGGDIMDEISEETSKEADL